MRDWFESLAMRERIFVATGALILVVALVYALVWLPFDKRHRNLVESVATWERSLAELRPLKNLAKSAGSGPASGAIASQGTPVVIVDQTLRARGLDRALKRSQPTTSNGIRVEFENVAFDDLVLWLGDLSSQHAMHVQSGSLSASSRTGPGRVNATLTLERTL